MNMNDNSWQIGSIVIHLLKGILYRDKQPELWHQLNLHPNAVQDYVSIIGLDCVIDENEGYAYLAQQDLEDNQLPRLVAQRALSYHASLLCVLLRKKLLEAESSQTRLILSHDYIIDMMRVYMPDTNNEVKMLDQIERALNRVMELGFVRKLEVPLDRNVRVEYEINRVIQAFVNADWLTEMEQKFLDYKAHAESRNKQDDSDTDSPNR